MRKVLYLLTLLFLSGCAQIHQGVTMDSSPDEMQGYLVGSFLNSYRESFARLAVEIENTSTNEMILIELQQPKNYKELDMFPVAPGFYRVTKLVRLGGAVGVEGKYDIDQPEITKPFEVQKGKLYYIGDFDGKSTNDINSIGVVGSFAWVSATKTQAVLIKNIKNNKLLEKIKVHNPNFSSLPLVNVFTLNKSIQPTAGALAD